MPAHDLIFGAFIPQGWKMELAAIDDAEAKWATAVAIAVRAEELGYDSVWVYDHLHNVPQPANEAVFECWTTMAALAEATTTIRLGQMVSCAAYRSPALVAKIDGNVRPEEADVLKSIQYELDMRLKIPRLNEPPIVGRPPAAHGSQALERFRSDAKQVQKFQHKKLFR